MFSKLFRKTQPKEATPASARAVSKEMEARLLILALKNGQPVRRAA
ncbi:MAG: hypothetical protein AB7O56_07285 [Bauldia sp.]